MSTPGPGTLDDGPVITAGEYVLGVLDTGARAAATHRVATDPAFATEVSVWEAHLTPLIAEIAAVAPPASLWPAIAARLGQPGQASAGPHRASPWDSVALWRALTFGATALAAASLAVAILPRLSPPPPKLAPVATAPAPAPPLALARLEGKAGAAFVATLDPAHGRLIVISTGRPSPTGKSHELWLLPPKAAPVAMGVLMDGQTTVASLPPGLTGQSMLAVSVEPLGGSPSGAPSGAPTGPVIAAGQLMQL